MDKKIVVILLDWGDTVMFDFDEYSGPMAEWPTVQLIDGIEESLKILHNNYTICLATNAGSSDKTLVNKALQRVGLNQYFHKIFTSKDLGFSKPQLQDVTIHSMYQLETTIKQMSKVR